MEELEYYFAVVGVPQNAEDLFHCSTNHPQIPLQLLFLLHNHHITPHPSLPHPHSTNPFRFISDKTGGPSCGPMEQRVVKPTRMSPIPSQEREKLIPYLIIADDALEAMSNEAISLQGSAWP
ncbi:hypothetical protein J437_LFUL009547 [Ladona fulva]|uniref:Uncharacterized protein n=1 Tax=Ladona fulva TaxID=123851 RepID=A0A8K0NYX6_LADFU|nr:hypothetical protein J437_LFUL009547 [Ladona fulva]